MIRKYSLLILLFAILLGNVDLQAQKIFGTGSNANGQIGDGTIISKNVPTQVGVANNWASIAVGANHTVAIKSDGTLWAWGDNTNGQLGDGTVVPQTSPLKIGVGTTWSKVACGNGFTIAIQTNGTLWAWGLNSFSQLGDGTIINSLVPKQIGISTLWSSIACGTSHTVAIQTTGSLWAWGKNTFGQIGNGSVTGLPQATPVQIGALLTWASVSCGNDYSIAVQTNGTLWGTGFNGQNQLGDGTIINKSSFTQIGSATNWLRTASGKDHSIALQANGTLWAWGFNFAGQVGDGTNVTKTAPVQIGVATNWSKIFTGLNHSFAIKTDNTLYAWGNNTNGEFGDATNVSKTSPTLVSTPVTFSNIASNANASSSAFIGFTPSSATLTLTSQPKHVVNCYNATGVLLSCQGSVTFTGSNSDIYYQWYKESPTGFLPVGPAVINATSLNFAALQYSDAGAYFCKFWAQDTYDPSNVSITFTTTTRIVDVLQATVITEQPKSTFGKVGDIVHIGFDAHVYGTYGTNPTYKPTVQWYRDTVRTVAPIGKLDTLTLADNIVYDGTKSDYLSITVDNAKRLGNYWAVVSGQCNSTTTTKAALSAPPTITVNTQPQSATVCNGTEVKFFVAATSSNSSTINYQWWANGASLVDQLSPKIAGSASATLTLAGSTTYTNIQCVFTQVDGLATATSNTASLGLKDGPMITSQPAATMSVQSGKPLVIEVGVASNPSNTITWYNGNNKVVGQTSSTLSIASATTSDAGVYNCVVNNDCGSTTSSGCTVTVSLVQDVTSSVEELDMNSLGLHETTPNPTNDVTNISFNLTNASNVKLTISDVYGNQVATLFEGMSNSGLRNFSFSANQFNLNSGVYFVTLSSAGLNQTKKFTLVK